MKVSKLFHWLYASVMSLPLLVAPIFAIYSHRHTIDSYEVTRNKYQVVDFNQLQQNNYFNSNNTYNNVNSILNNYSELDYQFTANNFRGGIVGQWHFGNTIDNKYLIQVCLKTSAPQNTINLYSFGAYLSVFNIQSNDYQVLQGIVKPTSDMGTDILRDVIELQDWRNDSWDVIYIKYFNVFNLTQMFGNGNEPTIAEFNEIFPNDYYNYTTSKKILIQNGTETLNNTDIGSQFVYAMYKPLHDYFDFNQFLGIGNLYNWFQLEVFNGTAPLGFYLFWEYLIYWLLVSLAWLIFDIAIYVPKLAHRWLDKASLE